MPRATVAYFVTPHGFGHAARSAAVIEALGVRNRQIDFEIVTAVPEWFFAQSLSVPYRVRQVVCDVGLVQVGPLDEDLPATVQALEAFWTELDQTEADIIECWGDSPPGIVVSDISPLGMAVADRLGVPSILVENFTWDWIYAGYLDQAPGLREFSRRSAELDASATLHVQCSPMCLPSEKATAVSPVSRMNLHDRAETRRAIGLDDADERALVLLTMGGMGWGSLTPDLGDTAFLVTLGGADELWRDGSILRLPDRSPIYPPDLVFAADAVIAKLGYSTVAECYRSGARLGFIGRPGFPESPILERFVRENMTAVEFSPGELDTDSWSQGIESLLALPTDTERHGNGADEIAELLQSLL